MPAPVPLTELSHGAGCGCKLPAADLHALLGRLPRSMDPHLLVDSSTADDAAVYRLSDDLALVSTADFFTPIVDDPFDYGRIAAANALSDVYAMGGTPRFALNLVAFPLEVLGVDVLAAVLAGAADAARQAEVAIVGGHSIDDREPKFGLAVTGVVHPDRVLRNSTGREGDELWLTKPLGAGVVATAAKRRLATAETIAAATSTMAELNRDAAAAALEHDVGAVTDVTGFGLLGHLHELTTASGLAAEVDAKGVPAIPGVLDLLAADEPPVAGGTRRNRAWVEPHVSWADGVPQERRWLLTDAMTSGGLLITARPGSDLPGARIGRLMAGASGTIVVR